MEASPSEHGRNYGYGLCNGDAQARTRASSTQFEMIYSLILLQRRGRAICLLSSTSTIFCLNQTLVHQAGRVIPLVIAEFRFSSTFMRPLQDVYFSMHLSMQSEPREFTPTALLEALPSSSRTGHRTLIQFARMFRQPSPEQPMRYPECDRLHLCQPFRGEANTLLSPV